MKMQWKQLYQHLFIPHSDEILYSMMNKESFCSLEFTRTDDAENYVGDDGEDKLQARITNIRTFSEKEREVAVLEITINTAGSQVPIGVKHGTYRLKMNAGLKSTELPPDMFEDTEVPRSIIKKWGITK